MNLALTRFDAVETIPGAWKEVVARGDYDDVAMEGPMMEVIKEEVLGVFGSPGWECVEGFAKLYVDEWKKGAIVMEKADQEALRAEIRKLQTKNLALQEKVASLEDQQRGIDLAALDGSAGPEQV